MYFALSEMTSRRPEMGRYRESIGADRSIIPENVACWYTDGRGKRRYTDLHKDPEGIFAVKHAGCIVCGVHTGMGI